MSKLLGGSTGRGGSSQFGRAALLHRAGYRFKSCPFHTMSKHKFYNTIVTSKQWRAWEIHQRDKRSRQLQEIKKGDREKFEGVFDVDEAREANMLSQKHWEAFLRFIKDSGYSQKQKGYFSKIISR